jgi:type IX secretion system PorP/SprF family membrane protein
MRKFLFLFLLMFLYQPFVKAQQQPQFTHYGFNGLWISPAFAGITKRPEVSSIYRYQWLGYDATFDDGGSPQTLLISAHTPVRLLHGGVGVNLMRDRIGNTTTLGVGLSYSLHFNLGEGKLGLGVQGNVNNIRKGSYRANDDGDSSVPFNSSDSKYDLGAGVWYEAATFYAGAGITNLLNSKFRFADASNNDINKGILLSENHIFATAGYNMFLTNELIFTPMALAKYDTETFSFDVGAKAMYEDKYWVGMNYRHQEAVGALVGLGLLTDNSLRVGYAIDLTIFNREAKALTSHEVMISYRLPEPVVKLKPPVRTPRYNIKR